MTFRCDEQTFANNDRVLTTLIPHTTSTRQSRFEVVVSTSFLKVGAFDTQNILPIPSVKLIRKLGILRPVELEAVEGSVKRWLDSIAIQKRPELVLVATSD